MKIKQPKTITPVILTAVGLIGGAMVSRVGVHLTGIETKNTNTQSLVKGALALTGLGGSAFIDGNDNTATLVRSALLGMGAEQALSVLALNVKGRVENPTINAALGLSCPCNEKPLNYLGQGRVIPLAPGYQSAELEEEIQKPGSVGVLGY